MTKVPKVPLSVRIKPKSKKQLDLLASVLQSSQAEIIEQAIEESFRLAYNMNYLNREVFYECLGAPDITKEQAKQRKLPKGEDDAEPSNTNHV